MRPTRGQARTVSARATAPRARAVSLGVALGVAVPPWWVSEYPKEPEHGAPPAHAKYWQQGGPLRQLAWAVCGPAKGREMASCSSNTSCPQKAGDTAAGHVGADGGQAAAPDAK